MTPETWQRIKSIFEAVVTLPPAQQSRFLDTACGADASLRTEVESLLAAARRSDDLFNTDVALFATPGDGLSGVTAAGDMIGRYRVVSVLGMGGMGEVYLADDTRLHRPVALKLLPRHLSNDPERLGRFEGEARAASKLAHPNVCVIYDIGDTANARRFITMEYVEGGSLRALLERHRTAGTRVSTVEALEVAKQVASGLAAAHAVGVVHRDVKPENIMRRSDGLVKVLDFGLAKLVEGTAGGSSNPSVHTEPGTIMGTLHYVSVEQASGLPVDARTDVWSLGVVLYEMLAGRTPFEGPTSTAVLSSILTREPPSLTDLVPGLRVDVQRVVERALSKERDGRYSSMEGFSSEIQRLLASPSGPSGIPGDRVAPAKRPSSASLTRGRRNAFRLALGLIAMGLLGTVVWFAADRMSQSAAPPLRQRIVVGPFENRTGEPQYDPLGFMAADWTSEGLQRTGSVDVVPSVTALAAARFLRDSGGTSDPIRALARETGANLVINGSIYRDRDSLVFQAQLTNAGDGRLVGAIDPIRSSTATPATAIQQLRTRLMGMLALTLDDRMFQGERPPTYVAYQAFSEGMDAYVRSDYRTAEVAFETAFGADTSFALALLYASFCHTNQGDYATADSLLRIVGAQRGRLNDYDRHWLDYRVAQLAGNDAKALAAIRHASELAPTSKATYNFAVQALEARQPFQAESALRRLSPEVGSMRGWYPYWDVLASALHVQGKHRNEMEVALNARQRFPNRIGPLVLQARAFAAGRKAGALSRLWQDASASADATPVALGGLAYEMGSEVAAHGDSTGALEWFDRAYRQFVSDSSQAARWGRARSAARLGRLTEAVAVAESLAIEDPTQPEYRGLVGVLAAHLGDQGRARTVLEELAKERRPFTWGGSQFEAGKVAAALGATERATILLAQAYADGYPYGLEFHRDPYLSTLRNTPIGHQLDAHVP